jgi:glutathione S-transferase
VTTTAPTLHERSTQARKLGVRIAEMPGRRSSRRTAGGIEYASINANGYVPALELDDGTLFTAPAAIVPYLVADQRPNLGLQPPAGSWRGWR